MNKAGKISFIIHTPKTVARVGCATACDAAVTFFFTLLIAF